MKKQNEKLQTGAMLIYSKENNPKDEFKINIDCSPPWGFIALIVTDVIVLAVINILLLLFYVS